MSVDPGSAQRRSLRLVLSKLHALPWPDRWLLVEAIPWLATARFLVLTTPFARLARWWGLRSGETSADVNEAIADRIGLAVNRVAGRTPWDSTCLAKALAAAAMLRRRGIAATLYLGARRDDAEGLTAHAWLRVGSRIITGAGIHQCYGVVGTFASGPVDTAQAQR